MQYRGFGQLDWKVSALGYGAMRLPTTDQDSRSNNVDEKEAVRLLRYAIDQGVNYLDTAYIYHGGNSEQVVGRALADGYRAKVRLATKSPTWMIQGPDDFDRILAEQLRRLRTNTIDFYLLHGLSGNSWRNVILKHNLLKKAEAALADGRIRYLGFSFHDSYEAFPEILNGYDRWSFCQIQYNYMDIENQAGSQGLKLAAAKGLGVVVMEPLLGGRLANPPAAIRDIITAAQPSRAPADWALRWLWDQPEVSVVLSGMSTMDQVRANIETAQRSRIGSLTPADFQLIARVRQAYLERTAIPCTKCGYCMPCPHGVNIPRNFELFNDAELHEDLATSQFVYRTFFPEAEHASACQACRECEALCPQQLSISEWMPKVAAALGGSLETQ
jgi:predicted aldo/keto reductase-like oxidoreductase